MADSNESCWTIHVIEFEIDNSPKPPNIKQQPYIKSEISKSYPLHSINDFYTQLEQLRPINIPYNSDLNFVNDKAPKMPYSIQIKIHFNDFQSTLAFCVPLFVGLLVTFQKDPLIYSPVQDPIAADPFTNQPVQAIVQSLLFSKRTLSFMHIISIGLSSYINPSYFVDLTNAIIHKLIPAFNSYTLAFTSNSHQTIEIKRINSKITADSIRAQFRKLNMLPPK